MPKLILRCNYLKNAPPSHLQNFVQYIGTREGVEKVSDTTALLPATAKQKELIQDILNRIEDADRMHEYYDYIQKPTRENASEFITQALENNLDIIAKKKNYIDYLANRPRVERIGTHGLFSYAGESVVLSKVAEEVASHEGVIWTNVISLRREDAERLGYDSAAQWQELLRSRVQTFAENYKIDSTNLKWYAAFHNESHHPHVHLVIYSQNPHEGYLTRQGIETMRSVLAHDIFRQDFMSIYERKTKQRNLLKEQAEDTLQRLIRQMQTGVCHNEKIMEQMLLLAKRLQNTGGKKVYGYLKADVKKIVNGIVDTLTEETMVAECYRKWQECQNEVYRTYKDTIPEYPPLSGQKEFKSIKNMVISEAVKLGNGSFYFDDAGYEQRENYIGVETAQQAGEEVIPDIAEMQEMMEQEIGEQETPEPEVTAPAAPDSNQVAQSSDTVRYYYADWTDTYKEARGYLYGTEEAEPDKEAAYEIMLEEAENGNALAMYDVAKMYKQGIHVEPDETAAAEWYQKSFQAFCYAERNAVKPKHHAYLEYRIGKMHQYGLGTEEDFGKAAEWFQRASDKNHKYAQYSLAMLYRQGKGVTQDDREAHRLFQRSHKQGNAYASYELAKMYEQGIGISVNPELATDCYRVAFLGFLGMAKKGKDDTLLYRIGAMYLHGKGTEPEEAKAVQYFEKSAEYGNVHAKYQLARIYLKREKEKLEAGQPAEEEKVRQAITWLTEFADQGNDFAAYALGSLYLEGVLTERDISKAILYLTQAADQNHVYAQFRLGKLYLTEECQDITKAIHYLKLAANQCNSFAAYRLGRLYLLGEQVQKDVEQAVRYLLQSADAGNSYAQYAIGKLYLIGKEIPQDKEKAEIYLTMAAEQGNEYAAYLLEHWQEAVSSDVFLMTTRLLRHLGNVFADESERRRSGSGATVDRKLRRKIREKKIAQGHAEDDHAQVQTM